MMKPFELVYKLMTTRFKLIDSINCSSPFILMTEISSTCPWELLIVESELKPVRMCMAAAIAESLCLR